MITYSAAGYWIDAISGSTPQTRGPGEYFPDMEEVNSAARRNRLRSAWTAIACAPLVVRRQAAKLVPASISTAWAARADARNLARNIKRLEDLGPHLLKDIGIQQMGVSDYALMETAEPAAEAVMAEPAVITMQAPAVRPVKTVLPRMGRASTRWAPAELAGAVMP